MELLDDKQALKVKDLSPLPLTTIFGTCPSLEPVDLFPFQLLLDRKQDLHQADIRLLAKVMRYLYSG